MSLNWKVGGTGDNVVTAVGNISGCLQLSCSVSCIFLLRITEFKSVLCKIMLAFWHFQPHPWRAGIFLPTVCETFLVPCAEPVWLPGCGGPQGRGVEGATGALGGPQGLWGGAEVLGGPQGLWGAQRFWGGTGALGGVRRGSGGLPAYCHSGLGSLYNNGCFLEATLLAKKITLFISVFSREALAFVQQLMRNHGTIMLYFFLRSFCVWHMVKSKEPWVENASVKYKQLCSDLGFFPL